jgi:hypothetical protein
LTISDTYFLQTDTINSGLSNTVDGVTAVDEAGLKSADVLTALGSAYIADSENINSGYPIFTWQTAVEREALAFYVSPENVTVDSGDPFHSA